jgi:MOSC domain-containing protein YiiM
MTELRHLTMTELEAGLETIRQAPLDKGALRLIVRRPRGGERELLTEGQLDLREGLVGDNWATRGSPLTAGGNADPLRQLTVMSVRAVALVAGEEARWPLAGDQLYIDMDIGTANLPPGSQLALGSAVIEITAPPHTGCKKFVARFGRDAMLFVNSPVGRELCLRGINARVVRPGVLRVGDLVRKV